MSRDQVMTAINLFAIVLALAAYPAGYALAKAHHVKTTTRWRMIDERGQPVRIVDATSFGGAGHPLIFPDNVP